MSAYTVQGDMSVHRKNSDVLRSLVVHGSNQ
jgi:hypothetical protein